MLSFRPEVPADRPAIEALLDQAFGPQRLAKASYAFRRGVAPVAELCHVADDAGRLVGTIRYWPIVVGNRSALLLGPLGVEPVRRGQGIGRRLIRDTLQRATALGATSVFLVGDRDYYGPLGFAPAAPRVTMPNEDPARLMGCVLEPGALLPSGTIRPATVPVIAPA